MSIDLDDARLLLGRAKKHVREFRGLFSRQAPTPVWSIKCSEGADSGYIYSLQINRDTLHEMKPVMADAANNLVHGLDHVAAACARLSNTGRSRNLFFPISDDDAKFALLERIVRPYVGDPYMDLFARLRTRNRQPFHPSRYSYLVLMKEMAGGNKHWNLSPAHSNANAVGWVLPGASTQTIVDIPEAHFETCDEFEFLKTAEPAPERMGFSVVLGLTLKGFASFPEASTDSAFDVAIRLVEEVIEETERLSP